jgi:DNA-binding NarL/FixJ family response regulator
VQRILWADDHVAKLDAVRTLLESRYELVGTATDGEETLEAVRTLRPDVVVLDISMPKLSGIDVARRLQTEDDRPAIVFLTVHQDAAVVEAALEAGALGYVVKTSAGKDLLIAIQQALTGERFISPVLSLN